jgi:four helix bundle protein
MFKESKRLAIEVHKVSPSLPKFELFEEGGQTRRSAKAVTSLITEGYGRKRYKADFIKYLVHAHAECYETIELESPYETKSLRDKEKFDQLVAGYVLLSKKINKFIQWAEEHWNKAEQPSTLNQ